MKECKDMSEAEVELYLFERVPQLKAEGKHPDWIESYCRGFRKVNKVHRLLARDKANATRPVGNAVGHTR